MKERITPESAEILALEALAWLTGRPDDIARFLGASGLTGADLRRAAGDRELLESVLDFLMGDEKLLLNFCQDAEIEPKTVSGARQRIAPAEDG